MSFKFEPLKHLSSFFFGCNYIGLIYGAFTFTKESDEKRSVRIRINERLGLFEYCREACDFYGE